MRTTFAIVALSRTLDGPVRAQSARRGELTVTNPTADARPSETITLAAGELQRVLGPGNLQLIHVRDNRSVDLLTQAIDVNDDGTFDELIFQSDLTPGERAASRWRPVSAAFRRRRSSALTAGSYASAETISPGKTISSRIACMEPRSRPGRRSR